MNNPTAAVLHTAARAQSAQEAIERATYLRALDDLSDAASRHFWHARSEQNYMETEHWRKVRYWIDSQIHAAQNEVQA